MTVLAAPWPHNLPLPATAGVSPPDDTPATAWARSDGGCALNRRALWWCRHALAALAAARAAAGQPLATEMDSLRHALHTCAAAQPAPADIPI